MAFTPLNGGLGSSLACSGTTARVTLSTTFAPQADTMLLFNSGVTPIYAALGGGSVVATLDCMAIPAGESKTISIPYARSAAAPTHVAGITDGSFSATLVITLGDTT